jgi:hypothetical protein
MKKIFTLALFCISPLALMAQEDCVHAVTVTAGSYDVSFTDGSQVPVPICTTGQNNTPDKGAWYTYTPAELHTSTVSTVASLKDTRVHIYTGDCDNLVCVGGDDDSGPDWSSIANFSAEAGVTYYIAFDNNWSGEDFSFTLTEAEYVAPLFTMQAISGEFTGYHRCIVDMNGDYLDDIVAPTADGVNILYQSATDSGFTLATLTAPATGFMPDWSMAAGDYDKNGYNDLLYGNGGGATVMLANADATAFDTKLESTQYIFSQRTNFVDIDSDGNLDAFVCHDIGPNTYFHNDGAGGFTFETNGPGTYPTGGNYASIWIDYDNDGDIDLFIAKCRGGLDEAAIDELQRNNGDGTFTNVAEEAGFADLHQSWSAAWADYDNDGDMDVMIGNSAGAYGDPNIGNPLSAHKLMMNNGDGTFTNVSAGSGFDTFTTPNLEHTAHDFNNDGYVDVFGGGNTIMFNNGDMTFYPHVIPASNGPIGDLNNDGFLDIQNGNTIYLNKTNDNNWIKIHLQGIESNRNGIGARVEVYTTTEGIEKQIRDVKSGDGFGYMSSLNVHFGIGTSEAIEKVIVKWPSGTVDTLTNPDINTPLLVVEGEHVLGTTEFTNDVFTLYPNPTKDFLNISGNEIGQVSSADIYDLAGRLVKTASVTDNKVSVQSLAKGTYIIMLKDSEGKQHSAKFIKG